MPLKYRCSISVDVDNLESLYRFYGLSGNSFSGHDPIYEKAIPRFLKLFDEHGIKATFFVIGKDCLDPFNRDVLKEIVYKGHEIANHSLSHIYGFSTLPKERKEHEIREATKIIQDACGYLPVGFRAPGYDVDEAMIDALDKNGYLYDSSIYNFSIYPIMRRFSYLKYRQIPKSKILNNLSTELLQFFSPMQSYRPMMGRFWRKGKGRNILEIPVSVMPYLYFPFNSTFLFLLGPKLFDFGFWLTQMNGMNLNYIFHAPDMLSSNQDKILLKHPGIGVDLHNKFLLFSQILKKINKHYFFVRLEDFAKSALDNKEEGCPKT